MEILNPTTPPEVIDQREKEATTHINSIAQEAKAVE
jgi:hypothetical protein